VGNPQISGSSPQFRPNHFVVAFPAYCLKLFPVAGVSYRSRLTTNQPSFRMKAPTQLSPRRCNRVRRAFTLVEIIIVVALIGGLMAILVPQLGDMFGGAQEDLEKTKIETTLGGALIRFKAHMGSYPTTEEGLQALRSAPANGGDRWRGPYVKEDSTLVDTWRRPYQYQCPGTNNPTEYDLWSLGPINANPPKIIGNWKAQSSPTN
jgi:general secretion pathway protein G